MLTFAVTLDSGVEAEMTAAHHTALFRFTFPATSTGNVLSCIPNHSLGGYIILPILYPLLLVSLHPPCTRCFLYHGLFVPAPNPMYL